MSWPPCACKSARFPIVKHLEKGGCFQETVAKVAESIVTKKMHKLLHVCPNSWLVVGLWMRDMCRPLKKISAKCGIKVAFSVPGKLASMYVVISETVEKPAYVKKHFMYFIVCRNKVVNMMPLSCSRCFMYETWRYWSGWQREYCMDMEQTAGPGHLANHCWRYLHILLS